MIKDYLNHTGLERVSEYVNAKEPKIFKGTQAEWDALTTAEKNVFALRILTDDFTEVTVDAPVVNVVAENNENAVSSGAVYTAIGVAVDGIREHPADLEYKNSDPDYDPPATVQTGETFDTVTQTFADAHTAVYGIGVLNKGENNEQLTRIIFPDSSEMTLTGW